MKRKKNLEYRDQKTNCCDQNDTHIGGKKKRKICITVWSSSDFFMQIGWMFKCCRSSGRYPLLLVISERYSYMNIVLREQNFQGLIEYQAPYRRAVCFFGQLTKKMKDDHNFSPFPHGSCTFNGKGVGKRGRGRIGNL